VLADEDSCLIRTNAGRRQAIGGCHGRRKRDVPGAGEAAGESRPALRCSGGVMLGDGVLRWVARLLRTHFGCLVENKRGN
jgi:hypothetical protein